MRLLAWAGPLAVLTLTSCDGADVGYVEIKAVPASAALALYLDQGRLEPLRNGTAVLRQRVGTVKLEADLDGAGRMALLCNIEVKKNRVTTVTVSTVGRPPRCQCGRERGAELSAARTCIG